ncbi:MAG: FG-GAP-like repeat-containing protein [Chitinophagales bacterium]
MRRSVLTFALVLTAILAFAQVASTADAVWVITGRLPEPLPAGEGLLAATPYPGLALAAAASDLVSLYRMGSDGRPALAGSFVPEGPLTALLLDDVDHDGRTELVLSRGEEGALSVDRWLGNQRLPAEPRYAWSELRSLRSVATKSGKLLVAAGVNGGLLTYLVAGRGLEPLGTAEPRYRFDLIGSADLDGDGQEELVASAGRVELVVFRWSGAQWIRWWQNYPWGGVSGAAIGDFDQDGRSDLAVASGERLLYVFSRAALPATPGAAVPPAAPTSTLVLRWQGTGFLPTATTGLAYLPPAPLAGQAASEAALPGLAAWGAGELRLLFFANKGDLTKGGVTQARYLVPDLREVLPAPLPPDRAAEGWPRLWLRTEAGVVETAGPLRFEPGRLQWETAAGRVPASGAVVLQGQLYLPLREVASQLGLTVRWDEAKRVTVVTSSDGRAVQLAADRAPVVDGVDLESGGRVLVEGGRTLLEARAVESVFPPRPGSPRLVLLAGGRTFPAADLL